MSDENTKIWNQLRRVPPDQLKSFTRSGGFKGTAIRPMWTIHKMTEVFGPCGQGWGMDKPEFQTITADDEIMVYCTVGVWHSDYKVGPRVFGVGGDKVRAIQTRGPFNDDEAFKKAFTDAVGTACKSIGAGADIHMGLWNGSKYTEENEEEPPEGSSDTGLVNGTTGTSKAASREEYAKLAKAIENSMTVSALQAWFKNAAGDVDKLPPDWIDELRIEYSDRLSELKKRAAA